MERAQSHQDVTLALYSRLLQAGAGASHHGSHEQDTAYYDRFGETILASQGAASVAIASLSNHPELLVQGVRHANSEVVVITLRISSFIMAADLPPTPDSHPAFFARFAALLGIGPETLADVPPRVREAAMAALANGCVGRSVAAWTATHLQSVIRSLATAMADGALHRIASSASSLLAALVLHFGPAALSAMEGSDLLIGAFQRAETSPTQLKLSILDFSTAMACDRRVPVQYTSALFTPDRQQVILSWLKHSDSVVRSRAASTLILLSRANALALLGGEDAVLRYVLTFLSSSTDDLLPVAAELLGGVSFTTPVLTQEALSRLTELFTRYARSGIGSRHQCATLSSLIAAIDTRLTVTDVLPPELPVALLSLLKTFNFTSGSFATPQRLFKVLLRFLEKRFNQQQQNLSLLSECGTTLLQQLDSLHTHRLHQLSVDVIRCLSALFPALSLQNSAAESLLNRFAAFASARLQEEDGAWEVRDSIAELTGNWLLKDDANLNTWCRRAEFVRGMAKLVAQPDLEPFVYATVSRTLMGYASTAEGWAFMSKHEDVYLACIASSMIATESLLRRAAIEMLSTALQYPHSQAHALAFLATPAVQMRFSKLAIDDDFEVRAALLGVLCGRLWPRDGFFTLQGPRILLATLTDSHRLVRTEACTAAQKLIDESAATSTLSKQHADFIRELTVQPLEAMRQASAAEAVYEFTLISDEISLHRYGKDVEEFLHPQSQANEMDCD